MPWQPADTIATCNKIKQLALPNGPLFPKKDTSFLRYPILLMALFLGPVLQYGHLAFLLDMIDKGSFLWHCHCINPTFLLHWNVPLSKWADCLSGYNVSVRNIVRHKFQDKKFISLKICREGHSLFFLGPLLHYCLHLSKTWPCVCCLHYGRAHMLWLMFWYKVGRFCLAGESTCHSCNHQSVTSIHTWCNTITFICQLPHTTLTAAILGYYHDTMWENWLYALFITKAML